MIPENKQKRTILVGMLGTGALFDGLSIAEINGIVKPVECMTRVRRKPIDWFDMEK